MSLIDLCGKFKKLKFMKIAGLVIGIILSVLSAIGIVICLVLVTTTNGRVSFEEALMLAIP